MKPEKCFVITVIPCIKSDLEFQNEQCCNCDNLNWLCFETEEICNKEFIKQYPEMFDEKGNYKEE